MAIFFHLLNLFTTGSLLLNSFLLLSKPNKNNKKATYWLSLFLFWLSIIFFEECFKVLGLPTDDTVAVEIFSLPLFVIAPTFYLSVQYFIRPHQKLKKTDALHLLPFFFYITFLAGVAVFFPKNTILISPQFWGDFISVAITLLLFSQIVVYLLLSLKIIHIHQKNVQLYSANVEGIDLSWLQWLIYGVFFMVLLWIFQILFPEVPDFASVGYFLAVYYLAYFTLNQKEIYPFTEKETHNVLEIIEDTGEKSGKVVLPSDLVIEMTKLNELMRKEKPYLDNELSLPKLSAQLQTRRHQVSYLLNKGFNENFYDYVNRHRVEESKKLLMDKKLKHLSLVGIAFEAGFNSKTAFNTAFKKFTGKTPSEFRKANTPA